MKTLTHSEYCINRTIRASLGSINGLYLYEGMLYSLEEIEAKFPLDLPLVNVLDRKTGKGANADKSKNYLNNGKSY